MIGKELESRLQILADRFTKLGFLFVGREGGIFVLVARRNGVKNMRIPLSK